MNKETDYKKLAIVTAVATLAWSIAFAYEYFMREINIVPGIIILALGFWLLLNMGETKHGIEACLFAAPIIAINLSMWFVDSISFSQVERHYAVRHRATRTVVKETWHSGNDRHYNISFARANKSRGKGKAFTYVDCENLVMLKPYVVCSICDKDSYSTHLDGDFFEDYSSEPRYPR